MSAALDRLRPAPHRGELVAAGGVVLAVGSGVVNQRMSHAWSPGVLLLVDLFAAGFLLALGLTADPEWREEPQRREGLTGTGHRAAVRRARGYVGVLLLSGYAVAVAGAAWFAKALGAGPPTRAGTGVWLSLSLGLAALLLWRARAVPVFVLVAAVFGAVAALRFVAWVFHPHGITGSRIVLALLILAFAALHARAREERWRESVLLVDAAGLATVGLALLSLATAVVVRAIGPLTTSSGDANGSTGWALVVLVVGCLLVAFAAVEREPGPGFLGVLVLLIFAVEAGVPAFSGASLVGWPLVLLVLAAVVIGAGLRPSVPAPPEPPGPNGDTVPLTPPELTP